MLKENILKNGIINIERKLVIGMLRARVKITYHFSTRSCAKLIRVEDGVDPGCLNGKLF